MSSCAEVVEYDPATRTYVLRPEVRPFVTGPGADNLARAMRYIGLMGQVGPQVAACFREGGGLAYADYPEFHHVQAGESAAVNDAGLVDTIIPLTGLVGPLLRGIDVADVGCGEGHAINLLARAFPRSRFTGFDFSDEALAAGRAEAAAWDLTNATFELRDVATLPTASFDLVTAFDAIHDQAHPATVLAAIRAALRPEGTFLMVDINASSNLEDNVDLPWAQLPLRHLDVPLHVGVARAGWRRARHGVGCPARGADAARGRLRRRGPPRAGGRPVQRLRRRPSLTRNPAGPGTGGDAHGGGAAYSSAS